MTGGVSAAVRELAARLSALFERDVEIVQRLNDAQRRLLGANDRLWSGPPDAFGLLSDRAAPAGAAIRSAFCSYQYACEERRQLAFEVGELSVRLTEELVAAGWSEADARDTDVHELAALGPR